jgi:hypothetical protein
MPLWDGARLKHVADIYGSSSSSDQGGGVLITYTLRTANVKGIFNKASASEVELFAQKGIQVSATFVTIDTSAQRGDKLVFNGASYHVVGINVNEAMGNIPTLNKLTLSQQL